MLEITVNMHYVVVNNQPLLECWHLPLLRSDVLLLEDAPPCRQHTVVLHQSRHKEHRTITLAAILKVTNINFNILQFKCMSLWSFCLLSLPYSKLTVFVNLSMRHVMLLLWQALMGSWFEVVLVCICMDVCNGLQLKYITFVTCSCLSHCHVQQ